MQVSTIRFFNIRRHLFNKNKVPRSHLSDAEIYEKKKQSRLARQSQIESDKECEEFFQWIEEIQKKLKLNDHQLAKRCGVSWQAVYLWKNRRGHYPNAYSFNKLLQLEYEARIDIRDLKVIVEIAA